VKGEALKGHLDLLLLAAVQEGPSHGYAIIESLRSRSNGAFDLPEGTVYPALHRLESAGLLASRWAERGGRKRRLYRLTPRGRSALQRQQADWRRFAQGVQAVVGPES